MKMWYFKPMHFILTSIIYQSQFLDLVLPYYQLELLQNTDGRPQPQALYLIGLDCVSLFCKDIHR